jgi:hypothetical protein
MAQTSVLDSPSITNLDALPPFTPTAGEGGNGLIREVNDWVTPLSADSVGSTYRVVRIPTQAVVKQVKIWSAIATAGAADIDVAFSDSTVDGTTQTNQGLIVQVGGSDNKLFGAAQSLVALAAAGVDVTFAGTYTQALKNLPMWAALAVLMNAATPGTGFTDDPGGFFDIVVKVTTAVTTGGILAVQVDYVLAG